MRISRSAAVALALWPIAHGRREDAPRRMRGTAALKPLANEGTDQSRIKDAMAVAARAVQLNAESEKTGGETESKATLSEAGWCAHCKGRWDDEPSGCADKRDEKEDHCNYSSSEDSSSEDDSNDRITPTVASPLSRPYKYESSKWEARKIVSNVVLDVDAFDAAVTSWSETLCDAGITATLFDSQSEMVYQKTVGTMYTPLVDGGYSIGSGHGPMEAGWTGDTVFTPYSNSKGVATATFLSSVVDTGLGYLDEPISTTFIELKDSPVGKITPRQIMSHSSGLQDANREAFDTDPYYSCKYDDSKSLRECLETFVLTDDNLTDPPGTMTRYNNVAFDILAVVAPEKTGMDNFGEIYQKYIADPLGMETTTYDCPAVKSTQDKPGVAWGLCSTGNDFPKFVQMLANNGMSPTGEPVLSKDSVFQMFSPGGGSAQNTGDLLWDAQLPFYMTRCYTRLVKGLLKDLAPELAEVSFPVTSVSNYGLGTMFMLGNYGEIFGHGGSTGGTWLVAPGRFSAYLTWMVSGAVEPGIAGETYTLIADILNALENASTFTVKNGLEEDGSQQNIGMCGDMYEDWFAYLGIDGMDATADMLQCPNGKQSLRTTKPHPLSGALNIAGNPAFNLL